MLNSEVMEVGEAFKKSLNGLSSDTKRRYRRTAIDFLSYNSKELSEINGHDIEDYLSHKLNQGISQPTYIKISAALNRFKIFCSLISPNVTQRLNEWTTSDSQIQTDNESAINQMRIAARNDLTASAVLELCYCGIRTRELLILKRSDVDFVHSTLTVNKGLNKRIVPLSILCIISLEQYLRFRMDNSEQLFQLKTKYGVRDIFKRLRKKANVKEVNPNFLRKTCGAKLLSREDLSISETLRILDLRSINREQMRLSLEYRTV